MRTTPIALMAGILFLLSITVFVFMHADLDQNKDDEENTFVTCNYAPTLEELQDLKLTEHEMTMLTMRRKQGSFFSRTPEYKFTDVKNILKDNPRWKEIEADKEKECNHLTKNTNTIIKTLAFTTITIAIWIVLIRCILRNLFKEKKKVV